MVYHFITITKKSSFTEIYRMLAPIVHMAEELDFSKEKVEATTKNLDELIELYISLPETKSDKIIADILIDRLKTSLLQLKTDLGRIALAKIFYVVNILAAAFWILAHTYAMTER